MKNIILCLIIFASFTLHAQDSQFRYGFHAGINYSTIGGQFPSEFDPVIKKRPGIGYMAGLEFHFLIKNQLTLKLEINQERKSQRSKGFVELRQAFDEFPISSKVKTTSAFNYIVLPILIKYDFTPEESFYVNGGPFVGYLLSARNSGRANIPGVSGKSENTTLGFKKLDGGLVIGLGKSFDLSSNNKIYIELRDSFGLLNISKRETINNSFATNSLSLLGGITFN